MWVSFKAWWRRRRLAFLDDRGFPLKFERQGPIKSVDILAYMRAVEKGGRSLSEESDDESSSSSG